MPWPSRWPPSASCSGRPRTRWCRRSREDQLVTANSASSINETVADLIGYPIAAAIVATLAGIIGAAFVLDAGTYLVSALLLYGMSVPPQDLVRVPFSARAIWGEMGEGWRYLTHHAELFWNTVISTVAQLAFGAEIVCSFSTRGTCWTSRTWPSRRTTAG